MSGEVVRSALKHAHIIESGSTAPMTTWNNYSRFLLIIPCSPI